MKLADLIDAMNRIKVETGSLACMGCGHEHNCGILGCAVIRKATQHLELLNSVFDEMAALHFAAEILGSTPERLKRLAQADHEERLVVMPLLPSIKHHTKNELYFIRGEEIWIDFLHEAEVGENSDGKVVALYITHEGEVFSEEDIGKTVFLSEEEATRALAKIAVEFTEE